MAALLPVDVDLLRVANGDVTLAVETLGDPAMPPILFLHGFPEHRGAWRDVARCLADKFYCLLPDLRGYRDSDRPADDAAYTIDLLLSDTAALVAACSSPPVLAGHDWGGVLAWWYADRHPGTIRSLVAANAPHPLLFQRRLCDDTAQRNASGYFELLRSPAAADALFGAGTNALWERMFAQNPVFTDADRSEYLASWNREGVADAMLAYYRNAPFVLHCGDDRPTMPGWTKAEEWGVDVPVLMLWGMADKVFLPSLLDGMDALAPNHRIVRFPDAGHAIIHEEPAALASHIAEFAKP